MKMLSFSCSFKLYQFQDDLPTFIFGLWFMGYGLWVMGYGTAGTVNGRISKILDFD